MKALINDGLDLEGIKLFKKAGIGIDTKKRDSSNLVRQIGSFDALIVRSSTKVTEDVIKAGAKHNLKIIGRAGIGYENIDIGAADRYGIVVKNAPSGSVNSVAELVATLIGTVSRNIPQAHYSLKSGIWEKKRFTGEEFYNKTLGVVGCGRIAQRLAQLVTGYNMKIIGYDKNIERVKMLFPNSRIVYKLNLEEVISEADYLSIHTGGNDVVIGGYELSLMKPTAYLINASRGNNTDEKELYKALKEKKIAGAALDVYTEEPSDGGRFNNRFKNLDNVVLSPHLGAGTKQAQNNISREIATVVIDYLLSGDFTNAVNVGETIKEEKKSVNPLFVHHKDVPGIFAEISEKLARYNINIRENPSRQLGKDGSAITIYLLHQKVGKEVLSELRKIKNIYRVTN